MTNWVIVARKTVSGQWIEATPGMLGLARNEYDAGYVELATRRLPTGESNLLMIRRKARAERRPEELFSFVREEPRAPVRARM